MVIMISDFCVMNFTLVLNCFFFFLMIRRPPRSTLSSSSAASDVYKRQHPLKSNRSYTFVIVCPTLPGGKSGGWSERYWWWCLSHGHLQHTTLSPRRCSPFILSLIHISEPTRLLSISYAVFCLKKKKKKNT
eukprot:TRINITY_DN20674_c0_g1_i2.p1 TRINITY_DN20674_c0_g1~~TRINITY_DN20674_c0_g1_i2.p1  ORF type:complete len:132 (-),score=35.05 TRINITY_DN20674_c0_g1_i2:19-414(-)